MHVCISETWYNLCEIYFVVPKYLYVYMYVFEFKKKKSDEMGTSMVENNGGCL